MILLLMIVPAPKNALAYDFDLDGYELNAQAYYLVNTDTGRVIAEQNGEERRSIASLTKIMTALVVLEKCPDLSQTVTVKGELISGLKEDLGLSVAELADGEEMSVKDLLYCLLLVSAADAANVLAEYAGGSVDAFVALMNEKAAALGLTNTHYVDPHGLSDLADGQYSTAEDQAALCQAALADETFAKIVSTPRYTVAATNLSAPRKLESTNFLLLGNRPFRYPPALGVKTGYTEDAGRCLASAAVRGDERFICVVLGCEGYQPDGTFAVRHFTDSIYLLENAFAAYAVKTACAAQETVATIHDECFGINKDVPLVPAEDFTWLLKDDEEFSLEVTLEQESLAAPVKKGEPLGECGILLNGTELGTVELVAGETVNRSFLRMAGTVLPYLLIAAAAVCIVILSIRAVSRRKEKRKNDPANKPGEEAPQEP